MGTLSMTEPAPTRSPLHHPALVLAGVLGLLLAAHVVTYAPSEPFYNNDESRHVMTGVFFRDLYRDLPLSHPRDYALEYYCQYPALGIIVWPPFFYAVEGLFMLVLGPSFLTARLAVGVFAVVACIYLFFLVRRTHPTFNAALATLLFGFAPLVFGFSRQVMLEVPTLACGLAALYHFLAYLDGGRRRDLALCALATALTALTRFDGVYLAPLFFLVLLMKRKLTVLGRAEAWVAILAAVLLVTPFYLLTLREYGASHLLAVREGTAPDSTGFLDPRNFPFYPGCVPGQVGWFTLIPALIGCVVSLSPARRGGAWPYFALLAATYLTFTPMAEVDPRHTIYWVPAWAFFAAAGITASAAWLRLPGLRWLLAAATVAGTAWLACSQPAPYVRGYAAAADFVVEHTTASPTCLFDSYLNGNFIYHVRLRDPARRLWVLRGDKVFYSVRSDPHAGLAEYAHTKEDVLALITKYDPEYLVVEEPQIYFHLSTPDLLLEVLHDDPDRFRPVSDAPIETNQPIYRGHRLVIYHNLVRNPDGPGQIEIDVLGMNRKVGTSLPPRGGP
jgi:Dolichyl-phosphate-mannose-protein mannosyltransferase